MVMPLVLLHLCVLSPFASAGVFEALPECCNVGVLSVLIDELVYEFENAATLALSCKESESSITLRKDETEVTLKYLLDILRFAPHAEVWLLHVHRSDSLLTFGTDEVGRLAHLSLFAWISKTDAILPALQMLKDADRLLYLCTQIVLVVAVADERVGNHLKQLVDGESLALGYAVELVGGCGAQLRGNELRSSFIFFH